MLSERFKGLNDLVFAKNGDLYFTDQGEADLRDPAGRLIGEIEVAVSGEDQVVEALEPLAPRPVEKDLDLAALRVEQHQPLLVVGDEDAAILVDLEAVGLAVPFRDDGELALRRHPQNLAVRDVDDIEIAGAVEGRVFEKAVARHPALLARVGAGAQ